MTRARATTLAESSQQPATAQAAPPRPSAVAQAAPRQPPRPLRTGSLRVRTVIAVLALLTVLLIALAVTVQVMLGARLRAEIQNRLADRAAAAAALIGTVDSTDLADRLSAQGLAVKIESAAGDEIVAGPSPDQLRDGPPAGLPGPVGNGPAPGVSGPGASSPEASSPGASSPGASSPAETTPAETSAATVTSSVFSGDDDLITLESTLSDGTILTLTASAQSVKETLGQLSLVMLAASAAFLLLASAGVVLVVRATLRPLDRVTGVARSIAGGDRGRRLRPSKPATEIGRVATAFDEMLDDLEGAERTALAAERTALDAESRMRAFVSDAAHELRTPVAGIRAAADTLVRSTMSTAERERLASQVAREAGRASRLITDLLLMARVDRGLELERRPIRLGELVTLEVERSRARRPSLGLRVRHPLAEVVVDADPDRFGQVIANLLDNAARATGGAGTIVVELSARSGAAQITVTDDGPGVPDAERERIFDRLVRLDTSRDASGGAGLGLPIARGIARAHGGDVACEPSANGARFVVTVPVGAPRNGSPLAGDRSTQRAISTLRA